MKIVIINAGGGNLQSVRNALKYLGFASSISSSVSEIEAADCVIFPGQGHFGSVMLGLKKKKLLDCVKQAACSKPFLGICIGMQILFEKSEESPGVDGLGLWKGSVNKLPIGQKIPQMGWNRVIFSDHSDEFYFANSFYCCPEETSLIKATTHYGLAFPSVMQNGSLLAVQFHPEKSSHVGLNLLKEFLEKGC